MAPKDPTGDPPGRAGAPTLAGFLVDLKIALIFLTRLPLRHTGEITGADFARASWASPLVGALIGAVGAAAYAIGFALGLPPLLDATLAVGASIALTGALHEDGLGDVADGFGGASDREGKLAIMRDSRIGSYAALTLVIAVLLRIGAIAALASPPAAAAGLIAAHAWARALIPAAMAHMPLARKTGLAADAGRPPSASVRLPLGIGAVVALLALGWQGIVPLVAGALAALAVARLARRQIGGMTGDVLGAIEQAAETAALIAAAAVLA